MLKRYPVKLKQNRSSNTLANKNINRIYGKVQSQYNQQLVLERPDSGVTSSQYKQMRQSILNSDSANIHSMAGLSIQNQARSFSGHERLRGLAQIYNQDLKSLKPRQQNVSNSSGLKIGSRIASRIDRININPSEAELQSNQNFEQVKEQLQQNNIQNMLSQNSSNIYSRMGEDDGLQPFEGTTDSQQNQRRQLLQNNNSSSAYIENQA